MPKSESVKSRAVRKSATPKASPKPSFDAGQTILFLYPQHPFHGIRSGLEPHFVRVDQIVDLSRDQMTPAEFDEQPLLLRDRYQVIGTAVDSGAPVSFFAKWMEHTQVVPAGLEAERIREEER